MCSKLVYNFIMQENTEVLVNQNCILSLLVKVENCNFLNKRIVNIFSQVIKIAFTNKKGYNNSPFR